jgi:pantoate--beta-alanine ligase
VGPDKAFFGQKDLQQCAVVKRLVHDLSFPLELIICPTERETDGLAKSSRNKNLSAYERSVAPAIYKNLEWAKAELLAGKNFSSLENEIKQNINSIEGFSMEYVALVNRDLLQAIDVAERGQSAIAFAAFLGKTRLIDNILL